MPGSRGPGSWHFHQEVPVHGPVRYDHLPEQAAGEETLGLGIFLDGGSGAGTQPQQPWCSKLGLSKRAGATWPQGQLPSQERRVGEKAEQALQSSPGMSASTVFLFTFLFYCQRVHTLAREREEGAKAPPNEAQ